MKTPVEQLAAANAEVTRLSGLFSSIPGGDVAALLTEHTRRGAELERLQGIEANWNAIAGQVPNGDVSAFMAENTRLGSEVTRLGNDVTRLNGEITTLRSSVTQQAEDRAAEIVSATGNQVPATAETTTATVSLEPADFATFRTEHSRLQGESPAKAGAYYAKWGQKFGF